MQYVIKSFKISFFVSMSFFVLLLCSTEGTLLQLGIANSPHDSNIQLFQNIISGLMSSSIVATIIYLISYQEKRDSKLNKLFRSICTGFSFLSEFYFSISKIQELSKNVSIDVLKNYEDYMVSIGCAKRFSEFINKQSHEIISSDEEFKVLLPTKKNLMLQSEYYNSIDTFLEFRKLQTAQNIEILVLESEKIVIQYKQIMAMQDEQQKNILMNELSQKIFKKQIELIEYLTSQKEIIKQILGVLRRHGDYISSCIGKFEAWGKVINSNQN